MEKIPRRYHRKITVATIGFNLFPLVGGEDVSVLSQTFDSTAYDDTTSVTSSNVHMELLSSKYSQGSVTDSIQNSDNDEQQNSSKKEHKKEKVRSIKMCYVTIVLFVSDLSD